MPAPLARKAAPRWTRWAIAAGVALGALYLGRGPIDSALAPSGPRATVVSVSGAAYKLPQSALQPGATLAENEVEKLRWQLDGTAIDGTDRDLRQLSKWKQALSPREAEWATVLRRAVFVSGARQYIAPSLEQTAAMNQGRMGVCFNYQMPQAEGSTRTPNWHKDFSESGIEPLEGLDPVREFEAMGQAR